MAIHRPIEAIKILLDSWGKYVAGVLIHNCQSLSQGIICSIQSCSIGCSLSGRMSNMSLHNCSPDPSITSDNVVTCKNNQHLFRVFSFAWDVNEVPKTSIENELFSLLRMGTFYVFSNVIL